MQILVTGSAGHLGEALVLSLRDAGHRVRGLDRLPSPTTDLLGSITDADVVARAVAGVDAIVHTATLHKPHVDTHPRQAFVDTNVTGTLQLLEAAVREGCPRFVFTSTTSTFGRALTPAPGEPAAWITEAVTPVPKNIYGVTKTAAEDLCALFHRDHGLACVVLRTSRFFPEDDDDPAARARASSDNLKANEFLYRRVELADAVAAHVAALDRADAIGGRRYIISATTPFVPADAPRLALDAAAVIRERFPDAAAIYAARGWQLPATLDRVYDNTAARRELGWQPRFDFRHVLDRVRAGDDVLGPLAARVGAKGYHRR
ncbi:MAG: NAD(P)-dependent oxidoreductase [Deltaproteobacteria bacterium]|nr:NAD(P)-dependent oxidoreductase [Deltaproteobacteria bacterium]MBK8718062.1 NAD(P)-dependent oxidoreductase [Deltaproteobacteria bacterium]